MTHIRDEINRVTQSRRMFAHGLVSPQLGQADLDFMDQQAATLKVDAWKAYTGAAAKGFEQGWFLDDEKIAYPMLEKARKTGVRRFCVHKGLPLGPVADYNHPRDLIKAAKDFPDIDFLVYHAGLLSASAPKPTGSAVDDRVLPDEQAGRSQEHLHGARLDVRPARHDESHRLRPPARADHRRVRGGPRAEIGRAHV